MSFCPYAKPLTFHGFTGTEVDECSTGRIPGCPKWISEDQEEYVKCHVYQEVTKSD